MELSVFVTNNIFNLSCHTVKHPPTISYMCLVLQTNHVAIVTLCMSIQVYLEITKVTFILLHEHETV